MTQEFTLFPDRAFAEDVFRVIADVDIFDPILFLRCFAEDLVLEFCVLLEFFFNPFFHSDLVERDLVEDLLELLDEQFFANISAFAIFIFELGATIVDISMYGSILLLLELLIRTDT